MKIYSNRKKSVKASSDGWKNTDYSIFMDGKKQNFGKYTKDFDGYRVMILPEYNPKIDILSWVVYLFEGNEEPRRLEAFETSYDAQDFADYEVYERYIEPITSSVKASYTYKYAVWVLDGDDNTWKVWSGKNSKDLGMSDDEFLDAINHPSFPNPEYNVDNNYVDVMVIDGDKTPADYGATENIKDYPEYNGVDASVCASRVGQYEAKIYQAPMEVSVYNAETGDLEYNAHDVPLVMTGGHRIYIYEKDGNIRKYDTLQDAMDDGAYDVSFHDKYYNWDIIGGFELQDGFEVKDYTSKRKSVSSSIKASNDPYADEPLNPNAIYNSLYPKIDEVFAEYQAKLGITEGDVYPNTQIEFDDALFRLADVMSEILKNQLGMF